MCYRYIPGLLERNDALREILKESDDKELNKDIQMMIEYGSGSYNLFMDNEDNRCIYYLKTLTTDWQLNVMFRTIEGAMEYVEEDKEYWDLLQMLGKGMKAGVDIWEWQYLLGEYKNHHKENE